MTCTRPTGSPSASTTRPEIPAVGQIVSFTETRSPAPTGIDVPVPVAVRWPYSPGRKPWRFATIQYAAAGTSSNRKDPSGPAVVVCTWCPGGDVDGGSSTILTAAPAAGSPLGERTTTPVIEPRCANAGAANARTATAASHCI